MLHQIHIQLFKLAQTMPNCHSQKARGRRAEKPPQKKIGSRLTTLGTTSPSFCPLFGRLTTCGPLKLGWNRLSFCQIWSNHISTFRYSKSPENLDFPGFLNHFDRVWAVDYRLLNCGALRAALRPYSPDLDPKRPVFMRFFGLSSLSKPIGKPTKSRNFWCSLTQPECSIHNAA